MRISTWILMALLILLVGRAPWLLDAALNVIALALGQTVVLAVLAAGVVVHKARTWTWFA